MIDKLIEGLNFCFYIKVAKLMLCYLFENQDDKENISFWNWNAVISLSFYFHSMYIFLKY